MIATMATVDVFDKNFIVCLFWVVMNEKKLRVQRYDMSIGQVSLIIVFYNLM